MFLDYTEEQVMIKETMKKFVNKEIIPLEDEYDFNKPLTNKDVKTIWKKILPILWNPEDGSGIIGGGDSNASSDKKGYLGNLGMDLISIGIMIEEMFRGNPSLMSTIGMAITPAGAIMNSKNKEMKDKYVIPIVLVDKIGCTAITEPDYGSNSGDMKTKAILQGDHWIVNGAKTWISNGDIADICMLACKCDDGDGELYPAQLIVDREVSPFKSRELPHMGLKAFPTGEMIFEDVKVPKNNKIAGSNIKKSEGKQKTAQVFEVARTGMALGSVGMAQAAIDASVKYAKERKQFGKYLGEFQMIQEMICDMATETEAARFLAYRSLSLMQSGKRAEMAAAMAKQYATEMAVRVTSKAIQIHGAYGLSEEFPLEKLFRDARMFTIPDGTTQIQKLIVARSLLGLSAFF